MNGKLLKREEVQEELTWRLEDIYPDETLWEQELGEAKELADKVREFEGRLSESAGCLYQALKLYDDCSLKLDRAGGYAFMRQDQDAGNSRYQGMELKSQSASVRISEELAFLEPEILAIPEDVLESFYEEEPGIRDYEVTIREIRRLRAHTLSKEMEQLLAAAGEMAQTARNGFGMLSNADLKFPPVTTARETRSLFPTAVSCLCRCPRTGNSAGMSSRSSTPATVSSGTPGRRFTTDR